MPDAEKPVAYAKEEVDKIKTIFKQLDSNGDGCISFEEIRDLLTKCAGADGSGLADEDLMKLYTKMDTNSNGKIEFGEFVDYLCREATAHLIMLSQSLRLQITGGRKDAIVVCVVGSVKFSCDDTEELVVATVKALQESASWGDLVFVTGGNSGVQDTWARAVGDAKKLYQIMPEGKQSGYALGKDLTGGATPEERQMVIGSVGDVYICFEGGPGVAKEARVAFGRGAALVPMIRTGGASGGMFDFPAAALTCTQSGAQELFAKLSDKASVPDSAKAAAHFTLALGREVAAARAS
mmetsp:Transcript_49527/g.146321  ORF Transcript_49527/g.146321 Transcript_49527/m.146321 type:complete len:295 (+) Transcript_49527:107-991(+)